MSSMTGRLSDNPLYLAAHWQFTPPKGPERARKAAQYLRVIRDLAINPQWVGLSDQGADCSSALDWIAAHIGTINRELNGILQEGLDCFHPEQRTDTQVFAAPILAKAGIDGFCNLSVRPVTLIVDPGRVLRTDWPKLVIHELAHSMARSAGHENNFRLALAHLCLAFDLPEPPSDAADLLQRWPPYRANGNRAKFWHLT